jgi:hypothetical protein
MTVPKHTGGGLSSDPAARFVYCFEDALKLLRTAADQWAIGDPEKPSTEKVLSSLLDIFERERFLRRPID